MMVVMMVSYSSHCSYLSERQKHCQINFRELVNRQTVVKIGSGAAHQHTLHTFKDCHPEQREGSAVRRKMQIPHFVWDDKIRCDA